MFEEDGVAKVNWKKRCRMMRLHERNQTKDQRWKR